MHLLIAEDRDENARQDMRAWAVVACFAGDKVKAEQVFPLLKEVHDEDAETIAEDTANFQHIAHSMMYGGTL